MRPRTTHIPTPLGRTYCGRVILRAGGATPLACIDLARDCIEDATCKVCQRSDDRRVIAEHKREKSLGLHPESGE